MAKKVKIPIHLPNLKTTPCMQIRLFFLLLTFSCLSSLFSQKFSSQKISTVKGNFSDNLSIVNTTDGYCSVVNSMNSRISFLFGAGVNLSDLKYSIEINYYDKQMNNLSTIVLRNGEQRFGPFQSLVKGINGKEMLIYYQAGDNTEIIEMYGAEIDRAKSELKNTKKILQLNQKNLGLFKSSDLLSKYKLFIQESPDRQKILFLWTSGKDNKYSYAITDKNLNLIKTKTEETKNSSAIYPSNAIIDNEGTFFLAYYFWQGGKDDKRIWNVLKTGAENNIKTTPIETDEVSLPVTVFISFGVSEKEIKVCGASTNTDYRITGAFMQVLDKERMTITNRKKTDIPENLMDQFIKDGFSDKKENKKGLYPGVPFSYLELTNKSICIAWNLTDISTRSEKYGTIWSKGDILSVVYSQDIIIFSVIPNITTTTSEVDKMLYYVFPFEDKFIFLNEMNKSKLEKVLPAGDYSKKNNTSFVSTTVTSNGKLSYSKVEGDIILDYPLDVKNIVNSNNLSLLFPFIKAKGMGLNPKQDILYYLLDISKN